MNLLLAFLLALAGIATFFVINSDEPAEASTSKPTETPSTAVFRPKRLLPEFRAIRNVPILGAPDVDDEVIDNELVIGVVVEGDARAYPINMLTGPRREIINDTLGGRSIAATW